MFLWSKCIVISPSDLKRCWSLKLIKGSQLESIAHFILYMWIMYMSEGIDYPCDQAYEPFFDTFQDSVIRLLPCIEWSYVGPRHLFINTISCILCWVNNIDAAYKHYYWEISSVNRYDKPITYKYWEIKGLAIPHNGKGY